MYKIITVRSIENLILSSLCRTFNTYIHHFNKEKDSLETMHIGSYPGGYYGSLLSEGSHSPKTGWIKPGDLILFQYDSRHYFSVFVVSTNVDTHNFVNPIVDVLAVVQHVGISEMDVQLYLNAR